MNQKGLMEMNKLNFEAAKKRYNDIMYYIAIEYLTIGERYSENTENWNIRDMVAECDYQLSTYYEDGHCNEEMRREDEEGRKRWYSETGRLKRFIEAYKPFIEGVKCADGHCSNYDNAD